MARVLREEVDLQHHLCRLLEPDYICFGYEVRSCFNGSALPPPPPPVAEERAAAL